MAYSLSFSPEFFFAEGEPYDRSDAAVNAKGNPVSVWSAIQAIPEDEWAGLARDVFSLDNPEFLTPEAVLDKIQETDTCGSLETPVDVWIDAYGNYTVEVWDNSDGT